MNGGGIREEYLHWFSFYLHPFCRHRGKVWSDKIRIYLRYKIRSVNQDLCQWDFTVGGARQHDAAGIKTKQLSKCVVGCHSHSRLGQKLMEETGFNALSRHAWLRHHDSGFLYLTLEVSIFPSGIYSKCFFFHQPEHENDWTVCTLFLFTQQFEWILTHLLQYSTKTILPQNLHISPQKLANLVDKLKFSNVVNHMFWMAHSILCKFLKMLMTHILLSIIIYQTISAQ